MTILLIEEIQSTEATHCLPSTYPLVLSTLESFFTVDEYDKVTLCTPSAFSGNVPLALLSLLYSLRACHHGETTDPLPSLRDHASHSIDWKDEYRQQGFELLIRLVALHDLAPLQSYIGLVTMELYDFYFPVLFHSFLSSRKDALLRSPFLFYGTLYWLPRLTCSKEADSLSFSSLPLSSSPSSPSSPSSSSSSSSSSPLASLTMIKNTNSSLQHQHQHQRQSQSHSILALYMECVKAAWRPEWKRLVLISLLTLPLHQRSSQALDVHGKLGQFLLEESDWMAETQSPIHDADMLSLLFSYLLSIPLFSLSSTFLYQLLKRMTLTLRPFSETQALLFFGTLSKLIHGSLQSYTMVYFKHFLTLLDSMVVSGASQRPWLGLAVKSLKDDWLPYCWPLVSHHAESIRAILSKAMAEPSLAGEQETASCGQIEWLCDGQAVLRLLDELSELAERETV